MTKQEIEMHGLEVDEMDFGSIGKTLSKYGKGVPKDEPKKVSRSTVHTDYTMTGHKEKKSGTGRVYTKVLSDYDDDAHKAAKATRAPDQVEAPKRGRGRPAGALNKNGSGVTGKGWSAESKAAFKAKLAAKKAEKLAATKNESELEESFAVVDHKGKQVHVAYSESSAKKKAEELSKSTGNAHTVKFDRTAMVKNESEFTEEDWAEITEGQSLDAIVEFMMDEEYQSLDELSKKTLGSYIKKSSTGNLVQKDKAAQHKAEMHRQLASGDIERAGAHARHSDKLDRNITKRHNGVLRAVDKLTKESEELDEAHGGTFNVGDVVSVDYHDISGKTHHGKANVDKATKGFVHVQHPSINGLALKFHQTVNGKATSNEVGTLPGTRAGGHRITKLDESTADLNIQRYAAMIGKNLIKE